MRDYQYEFIEFAVATGVLRFGTFTLKSGRISPYFFNSGLFNTGAALARLGGFYARTVIDSGIEFDMLFGPAYKGIPLVATTAVALADQFSRDVGYAFDRKETKDHGEGGATVGAPLGGRVLIVDDVITAGTAIGHSVRLLRDRGAVPAGVVILLDRQERGHTAISAVEETEQQHDVKVVSVIGLRELVQFLESQAGMEQALIRIRDYQARYGA